jgi:AbrB family looped-hinge helix DNA binding protein
MKNSSYTLKVSPQSQVTLPKGLRERLHLKPGSRVVVTVVEGGNLRVSGKLPVEKYFGTLPQLWTSDGQDAADFTRELRNSMQPKLK